MSFDLRERLPQRGRTGFILLYGVCGWGLLTGLLFSLAWTVIVSLPSFLLLRVLGSHLSEIDVWLLFGLPLALAIVGFAFGGVQWGRAMWQVFSHPPEPPTDGASRLAPLRPITPLIQAAHAEMQNENHA